MFKSIAFVVLAALSARVSAFNIHPIIDGGKCVGIVGGVYANGTQVDIFGCNNTPTQQWQWIGNSLVSINPTDSNHWCLDAGNVDQIQNGVQMKIWQCFDNLPQQTWFPDDTTGQIVLSVNDVCLDLTNGGDADGTILQIWQCTAEDDNQIWNFPPPS